MSDLPKKAEDNVNVFGVILIGVVSAVLVWVSVVALQAYYKNTAGPIEELREAEGKNAAVRALKASWTSELQKTEYSDAKKGLLKRLPIERAMELVVRDANEGAESLVPRLGNHDTPTVPAVFGKPADDATVQPADAAVGPTMVVVLREDGTILVDDAPVREEALSNAFQAAAASDPNTQVVLQVEEGVSQGQAVGIVDRAKNAGLTRFSINPDSDAANAAPTPDTPGAAPAPAPAPERAPDTDRAPAPDTDRAPARAPDTDRAPAPDTDTDDAEDTGTD